MIVVHSANPDFGQRIRAVRGVQSAGATRTAPLTAAGTTDEGAAQMLSATEAAKVSRTAAAGEEPLEADQWDLRAIGADKAAKTNPGSKSVTVAVIDVGVDDTHPDIAPNFSPSQSANCVGGKPDTTYGAWRPVDADHYHGTHVAGEIAAARNGIGVAGVAPGVKVSGITVAEPDASQLFYPESVVCAFVFAADHGVEITNNSYYVDPWLYNCLDDPDQRAIVDAVNRAQLYAQKKGTLNVAAAGNSNDDLDSNALVDASSPDDSTAVTPPVDPRKCSTYRPSCPASSRSPRPASPVPSRTSPVTARASSTSPRRAATSTRSRTRRRRTAASCRRCRTTSTASCRARRWRRRMSRAWPRC